MLKDLEVVVSDFVHWYRGGVVEEAQPHPAMVMEVHHNKMLTLLVFAIDTGVGTIVRNVWPIDSQMLRDNPELAKRHGLWTFPRHFCHQVVQEPVTSRVEEPAESQKRPLPKKELQSA